MRLADAGIKNRHPLRLLPLTQHHRQCWLDFLSISWKVTNWTHLIFSNESRFSPSADDQRTDLWTQPGQRSDPVFVVKRQIAITQRVTVWEGIFWDIWSSLVVLEAAMMTRSYVNSILMTVVLPMLSSSQGRFIYKTTLVHIFHDSPKVIFKDMMHSHILAGDQTSC